MVAAKGRQSAESKMGGWKGVEVGYNVVANLSKTKPEQDTHSYVHFNLITVSVSQNPGHLDPGHT